MRIRYLLPILAWALCLAGCGKTGLDAKGVSQELAVSRQQSIDALRYELSFVIPEEKATPVCGKVAVCFRLQRNTDTWLDFRSEGNVHSLVINGHEVDDIRTANEHIALPRRLLRKGDNRVEVTFTSEDQSLNRNDDYLYTLLVPDRARTLFPCFDQPDLKARYSLTLEIPDGWKAVSNTYVAEEACHDGRCTVRFAETEPLSTYLFSFVAGRFDHDTHTDTQGRAIGVYYREKDPERLAQIPVLFSLVEQSLTWLETYTGIPYPFAKYDFIVLPGFQYGGMEHTGATLYNDNRIFLSEGAGLSEELSRAELIAHETSHMWFGDLVTMRWFNDVWTKEVFANYFAAEITRELLPEANPDDVWLHTYVTAAMSQDRTEGRTAIQQELDNLSHAGLVYNNIIYNKAPVMMKKLVELVGKEAFHDGICDYLRTFAYANASWDDLVDILSRHTPADIEAFSRVWVKEKGMPEIRFARQGDTLTVTGSDPLGRGYIWPQRFEMTVGDSTHEVTMTDTPCNIGIAGLDSLAVIPNTDGRAYGFLLPEQRDLEALMQTWRQTPNAEAALMLLHDNFLLGRIATDGWCDCLLDALAAEEDPLLADLLTSYLREPLLLMADTHEAEERLLAISRQHPLRNCQLKVCSLLGWYARESATREAMYQLWADDRLPETYAMSMAWNLAIGMPQSAEEILATQRARLTSDDRRRQFDYVSRACCTDTAVLDSLFFSLATPTNRRIEPWTQTLLSLLNHPLREEQSVKYIEPALEWLPDIQRTGDIFFPAGWCSALLSTHTSAEAFNALQHYLDTHPDLPEMLLSKIRTASYTLETATTLSK